MKPGEFHINFPYRVRGECCRTGCRRKATRLILFYSYVRSDKKEQNRTFACASHGVWWVRGFYKLATGRETLL